MSADEAAYCIDQVRRFDRERALMVLVAPPPARRALFALFAFNVELSRTRETIREPHMGLIRLQWWRDALAEAAAGPARRHPVVAEMAPLLHAGSLALDPLVALIDARERDLDDDLPPTLAALEDYAASTAGALGRLAAGLLAPADRAVGDAAEDAGTAWALTGLLRAAPHLAAVRRCLLPADAVRATGLDLEAWFAGRAGAAAAPIVATIVERARARIASARRAPVARARFAAIGPVALVPVHLDRLARAGHDVFAPGFQAPLPSTAARLALARWLGRW